MSFLEVLWLILISVGFIAYLLMLFSILGDLFSDHETSGWIKVLWVVALLVFPILTALVYLIVRGDGMARRSARTVANMERDQRNYIRNVADTASPADQIRVAKELLDAGTISPDEFAALKSKALA